MISEIVKIKKIISKVEVYITDEEGEFLYNTVENCRSGAIIEIGSWKGKSTIWLGKDSKAGKCAKIYAIDPHTGSLAHRKKYGKSYTFEDFKRNIKDAEINDIIFPIVKTSAEAAQSFSDFVEFVFIDGDHRYEMAKLDFELWYPKLLNRGIVAFHDSENPEVRRVIDEFIYKSRNFKNIGFIGSIRYTEKTVKNSIIDRIKNNILLFFDKCSFVYHAIPFPKPVRNLKRKIFKLLR